MSLPEVLTIRHDEVKQKKIDQSSTYLQYIGRTDFNITDSDEKWQILRITIKNGVMTQEYALKGSFIARWDLRSTYFSAFTETAPSQGTLTVGVTAVAIRVGGSDNPDRKLVQLHNDSGGTIYWGWDSSVTTSTGFPILTGATQVWCEENSPPTEVVPTIYAIAGSPGLVVRIAEVP